MPIYFNPADMPEPLSTVTFTRRDCEGLADAPQRFTLLRWREHTTRTGTASAIMTWHTECLACDKSFTFTTGLSTGSFYRRCMKCRKGKQPTGWPSGPRIKHTLERNIDPASLF